MNVVSFLKGLGKNLFYRLVRTASRMICVCLFDFRTHGREHLDGLESALILSTHQSMLDPVLVGMCFNDRLNYIARKTLFKNALFGFLIRVLDAIEIDRERAGLAGLREMLKRLQTGKKILLFPEGSRTFDGTLGELKMGFATIARRSHVPLIPVAIVGAYHILPRGSILPRRNPLAVVFGPPITADQVASMSEDSLKACVENALSNCMRQGNQLIGW